MLNKYGQATPLEQRLVQPENAIIDALFYRFIYSKAMADKWGPKPEYDH